jgi:shikimate kinase
MDIFRKERRKKKKAHTGRLQSFVFLCASPEKRVERLNPKRQRQNFLSPEDKRKKKKKSKRNQEHQPHTHTHTEWDENKKKFFLVFLNRYKKVDDTREKEWNKHTHTKRFLLIFFSDIFS